MTDIPTLRFDHLTEAQKRAYILADNKIAENAGWDFEILAIELENLIALDLQFDIELTGFDTPEIDIIIGDASVPDDEEEAPVAKFDEPATSRPGDLWLLGKHRVICGDAREADVYTRLLTDEKAQMVFTDPPYNVPIDGHVSGLGKVIPDGTMQRSELIIGCILIETVRMKPTNKGCVSITTSFSRLIRWRKFTFTAAAGRRIFMIRMSVMTCGFN